VKIGVTGHQRLENPADWDWVEERIDEELSKIAPPLTGISSLAVGADQLFAELVLKRDGKLHVILPFEDYERTFAKGAERRGYHDLLRRAAVVEVLPAQATDEESYFAAGKRVVELSDLMLTVWNGKKAAGLGGTGDAVEYALETKKDVIHINPVTFEVKILKHD
jgi:hypothetical protein